MKSYCDGNPDNRSQAAANRLIRNESQAAGNNVSTVIGNSAKNPPQIQTPILISPLINTGTGRAVQRQEVQSTQRENEQENGKEGDSSPVSDSNHTYEFNSVEKSTAPEVIQMGKTKGKILLVQGAYMSGDRTTVGAALNLYPEMNVVILYDTATKAKALDIQSFYDTSKASGSQQIILQEVANCKEEYIKFTEANVATSSKWGLNLKKLGAPTPVTKGTDIVGEQFDEQPDESYKKLEDKWVINSQTGKDRVELQKWLIRINMPPGNYALLWVKTGKPTDEKAHHYTSPFGLKQLIGAAAAVGRAPVMIGEPMMGLNTDPDLTHFWEKDFPLAKQGRIGQLKFYHYLAHAPGYDVVNLGMRSGALEGPPLMGMRTIFMEESQNMQSSRMEQLLASVPTYKRVILDAPPGALEKKIWIDRLWKDAFSAFLTTQKVLPILEDLTDKQLLKNDLRQLLIDSNDLNAAFTQIDGKVSIPKKDEFILCAETIKTNIIALLGDLPGEWKQKKFEEVKMKALDTGSGEGFSKGEMDVMTHLLQIKQLPPGELAGEFYLRTRMKNVMDLSTFNPSKEEESQREHYDAQSLRRERIINNNEWEKTFPNLSKLAGVKLLAKRQELHEYIKAQPRRQNIDLYDGYVKALKVAIKNDSLAFITEKTDRKKIMTSLQNFDALGTYPYETLRESSPDQNSFDMEAIINHVGGRNKFYQLIFPEKTMFIYSIVELSTMDIKTFQAQYTIISQYLTIRTHV